VTQLSPHFERLEFEPSGPMPDECVPIFTELCLTILELVRAQFGQPLVITSGYRSPQDNAAAHGVSNSEHMATPTQCAADWRFPGVNNMRPAFDWMRLNPSLPFHQLILEHDAQGGTIIHVSINELLPGVRSVLEGATHNAEPYVKVDHVDYIPPPAGTPPLDVDQATQV
jgi:zinc D-Ala-D-Ala carboxypeptidase